MCAGWLPWQSDLAVLQVGVNVLDEGIVRVTDGEYQLAERAAPHVALLGLHPELQGNTHTQETGIRHQGKLHQSLTYFTSLYWIVLVILWEAITLSGF